MAQFPALPLWTDAYLADTTHLKTEEHGAYLLMLMACWRSKDCRLVDDDVFLARVCRCTPRVWARLRPVMERFWTVEDGYWTQNRLTKERNYVNEVRTKRVAAANAKHRKDKETSSAHAGAHAVHPHLHLEDKKEREDSPRGLAPGARPSPSAPAPAKRNRSVGSRIVDDWKPSQDDLRFAASLGMDPSEVARQAGKFRDHWTAKAGANARKVDWPATWRTWCRNYLDWKLQKSGQRERGDPMEALRLGKALNMDMDDDNEPEPEIECRALSHLPH
jgi:uncharacterized protein YdaU (DUF1376 family)